MSALTFLLIIYVLGGLTFVPCLIGLVLLHAYLTFPSIPRSSAAFPYDLDPLVDAENVADNIKSAAALASLDDKFQRGHEPDVAAGYFAVCREYVPGGLNGKPPERITPAGAVVETESPSVYQSMYRSIFERKQGPTLDPGKSNVRPTKKARNVFFVVLRHGHLMLYDDAEQVEVRHVISLEHHKVSIYGGGENIPEGELWIKRNAICLSRENNGEDIISESKPFYFFSENCSEKEDFYFALLQNQEARPGDVDGPPRPQQFENKDIISLVQQLHSSEEQLQTRWINAIVGRLFLAIYKTPEAEDFIRQKITKKIARVKKPAFLSSIVLRKIDLGESAPFVTNPRLRDLTIDGDCCAEADLRYRGNFRLEIATTARIDLGARFKVREVNLVLAAVVKRLEGHVLIKFKPPPSNRIWISFETMPDMELSIEPIVSSRQITYNVILRAIESRIREVIAETIVLPHWDDSPFSDTSHQRYRGGIWKQHLSASNLPSQETEIPDEAAADEEQAGLHKASLPPDSPRSKDERTMSMPALTEAVVSPGPPRKAATSKSDLVDTSSADHASSGTSSSVQRPPKAVRSRSFASAASPQVTMNHANVTSPKSESQKAQHANATSAMKAISHRSRPTSPVELPVLSSPPKASSIVDPDINVKSNQDPQRSIISGPRSMSPLPTPPTPTSTRSSISSMSQRLDSESVLDQSGVRSTTTHEKKQSLGAISAATAAAAKSWGWNVLNRTKEYRQQHHADGAGTPESPIGRGRPLPPPGQPLPPPEKPSTKAVQNGQTRRKPVPSSSVPTSRQQPEASLPPEKPPHLPARRHRASTSDDGDGHKSLLVVSMPSEATSPRGDDRDSYLTSATDLHYDRKTTGSTASSATSHSNSGAEHASLVSTVAPRDKVDEHGS
ncbi:MAG: hypothetical protein LQ346_000374 [Caloplaca aetnensis]|nr:MAG: hypothetical protein LQ346_000374 [Caloplaca aetnensis]